MILKSHSAHDHY